VYLHYVDAKEIVPILKSLSQSIQSTEKDSNSGNTISIEASESANALVINAPPALLNTMKRVVADLDIRRAQILVEALVVEVSGDVANDLGVSWITNPENEFVSAVNTLGDLPLANPDLGDNSPMQFTPGRGFTFGYFNNGDLQAAIRALNATQKANILSTPTIVAIDNEEASLLVGQNVPFKTGQATSPSSPTTDPFTTIERQDIGISLVVTPRINKGDSITLEIQQKTESIAPSVETASDIITNKREILTKALIKDDQVLVLGGLISDEETEVTEKVPFLGSIPLIGKLFSSTGKSHSKKNLMVFIHPVILKDEEHIREVTQRRYNFMQDIQQQVRKKEWQIDPDETAIMEDFKTFSPVGVKTP
jgi:general secretion pathway protein D